MSKQLSLPQLAHRQRVTSPSDLLYCGPYLDATGDGVGVLGSGSARLRPGMVNLHLKRTEILLEV